MDDCTGSAGSLKTVAANPSTKVISWFIIHGDIVFVKLVHRNVFMIGLLLGATVAAQLLLDPVNATRAKNIKVNVVYIPGHPVNRFVPSHAFGAAIDGHEKGEVERMLSPQNVRAMLSSGLKPLSYRLRTELAGEVWHWNSRGSFTNGYWTSSDGPPAKGSESYGYRLPRRGNTFDQANDDGYSRIDDGDPTTFWKSNPYLDPHFTGDSISDLPQWILIDFGKQKPVNAVQIRWGFPYAIRYEVQYGGFTGVDDITLALPDRWQTFSQGTIVASSPNNQPVRLSDETVKTRFVRILLHESSHTTTRASSGDIRDELGYAVRELSAGTVNEQGKFHDEVRHSKDNSLQTPIYVSSTDSWHRRTDMDKLIEQPGFDKIFDSGLTNSLPMLTPVGVLYNTPENAASELRYLLHSHYNVERIELGEEPDGQFVEPEDFAALYVQFADALHRVDQRISLGGPSFQDIAPGKEVWLRRFLKYLDDHGHSGDYNFASFEWYPFDDVCRPTGPQLLSATSQLNRSLQPLMALTARRGFTWLMTEYGYSAFGGRPEIDIEGALLNDDSVADFLMLGGEQAFLYGYEPNYELKEKDCAGGNNMLFLLGDNDRITYRMATYYGAKLLTQEWAQPGDGVHQLFQTQTGDPFVNAYGVLRPDDRWSILLVNKHTEGAEDVEIKIADSHFAGEVEVYQYSRKQYRLGPANVPVLDLPPEHRVVQGAEGTTFNLPPYSLTVLRGKVQ